MCWYTIVSENLQGCCVENYITVHAHNDTERKEKIPGEGQGVGYHPHGRAQGKRKNLKILPCKSKILEKKYTGEQKGVRLICDRQGRWLLAKYG